MLLYNTLVDLQTSFKQSLVSSGVLFVFLSLNDKSWVSGIAPRLGPCPPVPHEALDMSNAAKQRVVTMAQQRMLAVAASKEAMRSYLQHGQVLLLDAYKD